ncbi:OsmC family protein [Streptomyces zinciresistens K42]|uniref:OsmC family protein n=1 Tax=Streptomyces zinciresistens K42 TaxID=700597 RepID=G2G9D7_9ACTN|nr:OsmC family protein [Streptomyces zinciresistens]EGX59852.1 OsmC family protein [Streptomyces zinciresistens K42]
MRNGLDISGASELVHEIGDKPIEAVIDFNATAVPGLHGAQVSIRTAHHGTQRMARSFRIPFTEDSARPLGGLSSHEAAVAALGACVLITHVHGYSARGVTITSLRLTVTAAVDVDARGRWAGGDRALHDVRYLVEADCDGPADSVREVSQFVTCFSPNHRAFLDEGGYRLAAVAVRPDGTPDAVELDQAAPTPAAPGATRLDLTAELTWEYGVQATATTTFAPGAQARRERPALVVDQSKQMLGLDSGPNPQELLLAAVSADLTHQVHAEAAEHGITLAGAEVESSGRLDIRGMLNVSPDIPARFHNLRFLVRADTGAGADLAGLVRRAAARNVLLATLLRANSVEVEVRTPDGEPTGFTSDAGQVAAFLTEVARRQAAAAANNALSGQR